MLVIVKNRQTIIDIAIQYLGDAERAAEIAILNELDFDDIPAGTLITIPDIDNYKQRIADLFGDMNAPASAIEVNSYEDEWTLYYTTGLPSSHE